MKHARDLTLEAFEGPAHALPARAEWDEHVRQTGAEVYFLTGWQDAWWQHYGAGFASSRRPVCVILRDGGRIVAALPFCIETLFAGPLPVRVARLAGVDPNFAVMSLPVAPGYDEAALAAALATSDRPHALRRAQPVAPVGPCAGAGGDSRRGRQRPHPARPQRPWPYADAAARQPR